MKKSDVTVLVPTKNERGNVGAFLASLPPDVELIAVDASDDGTPERMLALRPRRTTVLLDRGNIARARQLGAEAARTPWLLFTDADVVFGPGFFDALERMALEERTGGVVGTKRTRGAYRFYHQLFLAGQHLLHALDIPAATGSNMLIAREALERAGGFDTRLSCNEDSEVMWRVRRAGFEVRFAPELRVEARDHRRLERGVARKLAHSLLRCALLYLDLLPRRWQGADWGYWEKPAGSD
jgi:GT2 family glycosyltransferase